MTILTQPASLSLSGNIKDFVVSGTETVRFTLYKGEELLLDNQYYPDYEGLITVSIKDIINSSLSFELPTSDTFLQQSIFGDYTATVGSSQIAFRVVRCGVSNYSGTAATFLTGNFLTWQPQAVETRYSQPQWLTYYNATSETVTVKVKYYLTSGGTSILDIATVSTGECISVNVQFAHIWGLDTSAKYGYYDVYIEDAAGNRLTYVQRYILSDNMEEDKVFLFENTLGGIDSVVFTGENNYSPEHTFGNVQYGEQHKNTYNDITRTYRQNSGYKTARQALWLRDFFTTCVRYIIADGAILPIVLEEGSVAHSNMDKLHTFEFSYKFSDDTEYQNLPRIEQLATPLEIKTPEELFFLTPRLAEFQQALIEDSLLIPVQSPYDELWKQISIGGLIKQIKEEIGNTGLDETSLDQYLKDKEYINSSNIHEYGVINKDILINGTNIYDKTQLIINKSFLPMPDVGNGLMISEGKLQLDIDNTVLAYKDNKLSIKHIDGGIY